MCGAKKLVALFNPKVNLTRGNTCALLYCKFLIAFFRLKREFKTTVPKSNAHNLDIKSKRKLKS